MFYSKLILTFIISYLIYKYMEMLQKRKEEKAERVFIQTMRDIGYKYRKQEDEKYKFKRED